jgi:hypothetical protein
VVSSSERSETYRINDKNDRDKVNVRLPIIRCMVADSGMPEQYGAETFRECDNCSSRLELPFYVLD